MAEHAQHNVTIADRRMDISQARGNAGLRTPEVFGRHVWIGLLMLLVGGIFLGAMSFSIQVHGPLLQWDVPLSRALPAYSLQHASYMRPITEAGFFIGGWLVTIGGFLLLLYFSSWHYWEEFWLVFVGMVGESLMFELINTLVARPRPPTQIWHILNISSFPSGHSEASVVFFGLMAYLLVPKLRAPILKGLIILLAVLIALFVGFCRLAIGGHYLSDVIAGYGLGLMWAGFAYTFVELYFMQRRRRHGQNGQTHPT